MAVAHDAATRWPASGTDTTSGDRTFTHTPSGTPKGVVVMVAATGTAAPCTGVTYGSLTLVKSQERDDTSEAGTVLIYVSADGATVPTGAQTVTIQGAGTMAKWATCATVTAATASTYVFATSGVDTTTAANPSLTHALLPNCMMYGVVHTGAAAPSATPLSGTTLLHSQDYGALSAQTIRATSGSLIGNNTIGVTLASEDYAMAVVSIAEFQQNDSTLIEQAPPKLANFNTTGNPTLSIPVASGTDTYLIVELTGEGNGIGGDVECTAMTHNGDAMTRLSRVYSVSNSWGWAEVWYRANPDVGTFTISGTLNAGDDVTIKAQVYDGAAAPTSAAIASGSGTSVTATAGASPGADDLLRGVCQVDGGSRAQLPGGTGESLDAYGTTGNQTGAFARQDGSNGNSFSWSWLASSPYCVITYIVPKATSGTGHTQNPSDSVTMSDSIAIELVKAVADTVGLADSQAYDRGKALADTLGLADSLSSAKDVPLAQADSVTMSDNATQQLGKEVNPADSVTISDAQTFDRGLGVADSLGLADSVVFDRSVLLSDSVSPSDLANFARDVLFGDTLGVSDAFDRNLTLGRTFGDSVTLSDDLQRILDIQRAVNDSVTASDAFDRVLEYVRAFDDSVSLSDGILIGKDLSQAFNDSVALSDSAEPLIVKVVNVDDAVSVTDMTVFAVDRAINVNDTLPLTDETSFERGVLVEDALSLSDALERSYGLSAADVLALSDLADPVLELGQQDHVVNVDDSITVSDALSFIRGVLKSDSVVISDSHQRHLNGVLLSDGETAILRQGIIYIGRF